MDVERTDGQAVYISQKHGWFWIVSIGQRSIYWGPYATKEIAEREGPKNSD